MATTTTETRTVKTVKGIALGMFVAGLGLSVVHTFDFFHHDLGAQVVTAAFVPVFVDGIQIIGRLARGDQFAYRTRKIGLAVQLLGAALALIANVVAGHAIGDKVAGAIFVLGYIGMEAFAAALRPASDDLAEQAQAKKAAAVAKGKATRAANKAKATATARKTRAADIDRPLVTA